MIENEEGITCVVDAKSGKYMGDGKSMEIGRDERFQKLYKRDPDEWQESGFTGNEGATAEHWYNTTVESLSPSVR